MSILTPPAPTIGPGHARKTIATPFHVNRIHLEVQAGGAEQIAEIADRQRVYLRSNNREPRHQHEASTMTDTRRAWSGAETACQPGRTYRFSTLGPVTFNPALQRDGSERKRTASAYASSMNEACLELVARVGSTEAGEASIARLTR